MPKTVKEIGVDVLFNVGELATGQTPSAADLKVCTDKYNQVWAMLQVPELLADWAVGDSIPDIAIDPIVALVSYGVRTKFGVSGQTLADITEAGHPDKGTAKPQLRANVHVNWTGNEEPTKMEYF